jgi:hypothetical protein
MDYKNTQHKIRTTYVQTNNNEIILSQFSPVKNNYFVTDFKNNVSAIKLDNIAINSSSDTIFSVELNNIDEKNISYLKQVLVFTTTEGFQTNSIYLNYTPAYHSILEYTESKYILRMYIKKSSLSIPLTAKLLLYISNERQF